MLKPRVHVCLLHNTATANVTPALDPCFRPEEVVLVYGPRQKHRSACLESVLASAGVRVTHWPLKHIFELRHVRDRILELLAEREGDDLALNASGGTRPMVVGAFEVFQEMAKPVFYVHPETDLVTWVHRGDLPSFNCANRIRLSSFLCVHGATQIKTASAEGIPENLRELTGGLIREIDTFSPALAALNWLAQKADNSRLLSPEMDGRQRTWKELRELLERFAAEGLLSVKDGRVQFPGESARFYVNGGWMEQHVFGVLFGLRKDIPEIQDLGRSVEFVRQSNNRPVKNELDVAFLANNRCYIIECKTKRFSCQSSDCIVPDSPGADVLYKLDTMKYLVGEGSTRAMLISYRDLPKWDMERARDLGIYTCIGRQLLALESRLRRWIESQGRPF